MTCAVGNPAPMLEKKNLIGVRRKRRMTRIKVNFIMSSCDSELSVPLYVDEKGHALLKRIVKKIEDYPREGNHPCNYLEVVRVARGD